MTPADHPQATAVPAKPPDTLRRLLVAVDASDAAGSAAAFAIRLAGTAGADVTLLHACPDVRPAEHTLPIADPDAVQAAAEQRVAEAAAWRRRLLNLEDYAADGAAVHSKVVRGRAATAILETAQEIDADLILIGSRGLGAIRGRLLGSVSAQVAEHAASSVMVFPAGRERAPAHLASVVAGVDGSPGAAEAVQAGAALASALGARLVLVSAIENASALVAPTMAVQVPVRRRAQRVLAEARESVAGDVEVVEVLDQGPPRAGLVAAAERHAPSVLAVGSRGLGGFRGLLLGGTARWILHHAPCPVLVARSRP